MSAVDWITLGGAETTLSFGKPVFSSDGAGYIRLPVRMAANGVIAERTLELEGWGTWIADLLEFLDGLASLQESQSGEIEWSGDERTLVLRVTWRAAAGAALRATVVQPDKAKTASAPGARAVTVLVPFEPTTMSVFADRVRIALRSEELWASAPRSPVRDRAELAAGMLDVRKEVASLFRNLSPEDLVVFDRGDGSAEYRVLEAKRRAISVPGEELPPIPAVAHLYDARRLPPHHRHRDDGALLAVVIIYLGEYVKDIPLPVGSEVVW
jgi:hypothetical protein